LLLSLAPLLASSQFRTTCSSFGIFHGRNISRSADSRINSPPSDNMNAKLVEMEKKSAKFWNRIADNYAKQPVADEASYQKKLEITRGYFGDKKTAQVLEFGCGTGSTALAHSPYVKEIYGIDVSSKMIEIAQEKAKKQGSNNIKFDALSMERLDVPDGSYDVVLGMSILHLLPDKDKAIAKVHKVLKPRGVFISSTVCAAEMGAITGSLLKYMGPLANFFGLIPNVNVFHAEELKSSITKAGFVIEREFRPSKDKVYFCVARKE